MKTTKNDIPAYGLVRVSSKEQFRKGISPEYQREQIEEWARFRGVKLEEIFEDKGFSGKNLDRPGMKKLLEVMKNKEKIYVIVFRIDRLTRNNRDLLWLIDEFFRNKHIIISITEYIDATTPGGRASLSRLGADAQLERETTIERVERIVRYKREKGERIGHIPFGYMLENKKSKKLVKNLEEQKVLRRIRRWKKEGRTYREMAETLNKDKVCTHKPKTSWHPSSIWYILNRSEINYKNIR